HDSSQAHAHAIEDGAGGAFLVWWDDRLSIGYHHYNDLYGQHISAEGQLLWEIEGRLLAHANDWRSQWDLCPDGWGGFFAAWSDGIHTTEVADILAQHFNCEGTAFWSEPVSVTRRSHWGYAEPRIAPHPDGGCYVSYEHGLFWPYRIFGQRLSADGQRLWRPGGVDFDLSYTYNYEIIPDERGGIFFRNFGEVARIDENGRTLWMREINNNTFDTAVWDFGINPFNDLLYVLFRKHNPYGSWNEDIFGTALDFSGHFRFPASGMPVIVEPTADQNEPHFCFRNNGMVIHCGDERNYPQTEWDIYFQITDSLWRPLLDPAGAPWFIRAQDDLTSRGRGIISDNADGAIAFSYTYEDSSFANHILADGSLGYPLPRPVEALPLGQIQGISPEGIRFHLNEGGDMRLELYDLLGRKVQTLMEGYLAAGDHQIPVPVAGLSSGFYIVRLSAEGWRTTAKAMVIK
ncbi:MAG TPA: hypothetical protein VF398_07165, partial [bacterium]